MAGGTGGAKLADGFARILEPGALTVVVNVGDDFEHWGLHISPDLDSVTYALAGLTDAERGWGVRDDTWTALGMLSRLGAPEWFRIGDADLALHVRRTELLRAGSSLTDVTAAIAAPLGIAARVLPATDDRLRTLLQTDAGELDFQTYFVAHRQADEVRGVRFDGIEAARPTAAVLSALADADLIVLAPSNPIVSIGPILEIQGMRQALASSPGRRIAVSPIISGRALKGPADRMLTSLGHEASALGVARLYAALVDAFVLDDADGELATAVASLGVQAAVLPTVMGDGDGRADLARRILALGSQLRA
ncbi:MAG: 2-phospho-L-lactate transferase [Chloroflexota bacterium]